MKRFGQETSMFLGVVTARNFLESCLLLFLLLIELNVKLNSFEDVVNPIFCNIFLTLIIMRCGSRLHLLCLAEL